MRVPHEVKHVQKLQGMHYHYRPEIFLQLQGRTDFQFPKESFSLNPDEFCVIPAGVPHGEIVHAEAASPSATWSPGSTTTRSASTSPTRRGPTTPTSR